MNEDLVEVLQEIAGDTAMAGQDAPMPQAIGAGAPADPFALFQAYMDKQFSSLKSELSTLKEEVGTSVKEVSAQVATNTANIKNIQEGIGTQIEEKVAAAVSKEMAKITDTSVKIQSSGPSTGRVNRCDSKDNGAYWRSRRSVRCWPINGPDCDLWGLTGDFFTKILRIPPSNLPQESVETIRRLGTRRSNRPNKIQNEVLVVFRDVATRDMVMSYAANLAAYKHQESPPGVRLDYPDHLRGVFSTLESYGHQLRQKLGPKLKRSIKYDDTSMSMYIDICFPDETKWSRISLNIAEEEVAKEKAKEADIVRQRLDSLSGVGTSELAVIPAPKSPINPRQSRPPSPTAGPSNRLPMSSTLQQFHNSSAPKRWGGTT